MAQSKITAAFIDWFIDSLLPVSKEAPLVFYVSIAAGDENFHLAFDQRLNVIGRRASLEQLKADYPC